MNGYDAMGWRVDDDGVAASPEALSEIAESDGATGLFAGVSRSMRRWLRPESLDCGGVSDFRDYWYPALTVAGVAVALAIVGGAVGHPGIIWPWLGFTLMPMLALSMRRYADAGVDPEIAAIAAAMLLINLPVAAVNGYMSMLTPFEPITGVFAIVAIAFSLAIAVADTIVKLRPTRRLERNRQSA